MKFRTDVEAPEPMKGLEVPAEVVEALRGGKRSPVSITINRHSWKRRIAIMRGRHLIGLNNANRRAADVATGDEVEVEVVLDVELRVVIEPTDFVRALDADPTAALRTTDCPTVGSGNVCVPSKAPRSPRPGYDG